MGGDNLVNLSFRGIFGTGDICQSHKKVVTKAIVCLFIPIVKRVKIIWHELFVKLIFFF